MNGKQHPAPGDNRLAQFERLLRTHQGPLFSYIHSLVRNLSDAEDVFQQVSLILWKKFPEFDPHGSFLAWGCGVARLEVMNFLRVRGRSRLYFNDELTLALIDAQVEVCEDGFESRRAALGGCVDRLRERDQELLAECYGESGGVAAAADRRSRSTQSIHNSLRRIRRSLWLINAQNCRWAADSSPAGDFRPGGIIALDSGLAELRFQSGATVILEGPARLELVSGDTARLRQGRLSAHVPERARGFQILSANGRVVDLGTDFGLSVDDSGAAEVFVFTGSVEAHARAAVSPLTTLTSGQAARIDASGVRLERQPSPQDAAGAVRAIELPARLVPRTLTLDFRQPFPGTLRDDSGRGTGLTSRLPGTGQALESDDGNLLLNPQGGRLELTTTNSDINAQFQLDRGEYLGVKLSDLGFAGQEDFEVTATFASIPAMEPLGQFGLYAGTSSDRNIRGGLIAGGPGDCTQFVVNNHGGQDSDLQYVGVTPYHTDVTLTLRRSGGGRYTLTANNHTNGATIALTTKHPAFLDDADDLYVGLFGANVQSNTPRNLLIKHFQVTVWTMERN